MKTAINTAVRIEPCGFGLDRVLVDTSIATSWPSLSTLLDDGVVRIRGLILESALQSRGTVVDIRVAGNDSRGAGDAMVFAVKGLIRAYTLESPPEAPPVNVVVTEPHQTLDREATWRFLSDPDGAMARGATFDLREVVR